MELASRLSENLCDDTVARRLRWGIGMLMLVVCLVAFLETSNAPRLARLWLFLPLFGAVNIFYQAWFKSCGLSAMQGVRHTADGVERIAVPEELQACRRRGRKQLTLSLVSSCLSTLLFVLIG